MKKYFILIFLCAFASYAYTQESNTLSNSEKIYGLSKFWSEVTYNFANFENVPTLNWDSAYLAFIPKVLDSKSDDDYFDQLSKFAALLKDGHTNIWHPDNYYKELSEQEFGEYRFKLENIENKAIVVRVNASKVNEIPLGSEIIEVNDLPVDDYLEKNTIPIIHETTDYTRRDAAVKALLLGKFGQEFRIKLKTPGGEIKSLHLTVKTNKDNDVIPPFSSQDSLFSFKWIDNQIAYLSLNSFADSKIDSLFKEKLPELRKAKGIIIDVRKGRGGNESNGTYIAQYFIEDTVFSSHRTKTRKNLADMRYYGSMLSPSDTLHNPQAGDGYNCFHNNLWEDRGVVKWPNDIPKKDRLLVPVVILMGHQTTSASEDFLLCFDKSKNVVKMGQYSCGSSGNLFEFKLVGGAKAGLCVSHVTYPDGRVYVGAGVKPDIQIEKTIDDVINNRDSVLEEAVKYLQSHKNTESY